MKMRKALAIFIAIAMVIGYIPFTASANDVGSSFKDMPQ